jgi:tRNA threonylcarbamoyladenosine biosynthesis protein TsaB
LFAKTIIELYNQDSWGANQFSSVLEADWVTADGILKSMGTEAFAGARLLLIDTCGDPAAVALTEGKRVRFAETLPRQRASAEIVAAIQRMMNAAGWRLAELRGIGVVHGPGSFTGVRTGLSIAKGLSEAAGLPVSAVSRLAVLAQESSEGFAVLDAGRNEVYVRGVSDGCEFLCSDAGLLEVAAGCKVVIAEDSLRERFATLQPELRPLEAGSALPLVLEEFLSGGVDVALLDAHYLREESCIYKQIKP